LRTQPDGKLKVVNGPNAGFNLYAPDSQPDTQVYFAKDKYTAWVVNREMTISPRDNLDLVINGFEEQDEVKLTPRHFEGCEYVGMLICVFFIHRNMELKPN